MNDTVKPCPHCGGSASLSSFYSYRQYFYYVFVKCDICGAQGKTYKSIGKPSQENWNNEACIDALNAWNMRTYES